MQTDYFYPSLGDRTTPEEWSERGADDLLEIARRKTEQLLASPEPTHIDDATDAAVRARFPIRL